MESILRGFVSAWIGAVLGFLPLLAVLLLEHKLVAAQLGACARVLFWAFVACLWQQSVSNKTRVWTECKQSGFSCVRLGPGVQLHCVLCAGHLHFHQQRQCCRRRGLPDLGHHWRSQKPLPHTGSARLPFLAAGGMHGRGHQPALCLQSREDVCASLGEDSDSLQAI